MTENDLSDFVTCYNPDNILNRKPTYDENHPNGRWREYNLQEIKSNDYKLDLKWMQEDDGSEDLSLKELFAMIKQKSQSISDAVKE